MKIKMVKQGELPTMLTGEPFKAAPADCRCNRKILYIPCNDGRFWAVNDLASAMDISYNTIICRLRRFGWKSKYILMRPMKRGYCADGSAVSKGMKSGEIGNAAWQALGSKPRTYNLKKIKQPGTFEMRC